MLIYSLQPHHIIQVSCGADFTLCVDNAGGVHSWGMGNYGNLGHGDTRDYSRPKLVHRLKSEVIRMVSGGAKHSLAVSQSGEIWAFGHGDNGRLGNNATRGSLVPERALGGIVTALAVFVSAGEAHSACLDDAGKLYTWGTGSYGRLGSGQETDQLVPVIVETLAKVKMMTVSCGAFHTCTVSLEGEMYVFGGGLYGKLGNESEENCILPGKLLGDDQVSGNSYTQVACGTFHTVAVNEEGACLSWGFGGHGRLGIGSAEQRRKPVPVHGGFLKSLITGSSSQRFVRSIMNISDSLMKQKRKGGSGGGAGGAGGAPGGADKFLDDESPTKIVSVAAGAKHSLYMTVEGHVYSWGSDENGQCGQERDAGQGPHIPEQVKAHIGGLRVVGIACGAEHSLCVTARGDVYTWGQGSSGQLGHGSQSSINRPALVQLLSAHLIVAVDGGEDNSAAITDAGELYTWGAGEMGKLGQGQATTSALLPARVRGELSDKAVKTVSLGLGHTAVIVDQGTLYTWGAGWYGRLGHNDQTNVYMPKRIASMVFKQFETVSCGSYHTLAVSKDNQCYAWGRGDERLGSSQTNNQLVPKTVIGVSRFSFRSHFPSSALSLSLLPSLF